MKSTNAKLKHLFYCLIPLLIVLSLEWMDNFIDWKKQNLVIRKDVATATIVENPFYHYSQSIKFLDDNGEFDLEKFENTLLDDGLIKSKKIKYSYEVDGKKYVNYLNYSYSVDYGSDPEFGSYYSEWDNQFSEYMPKINRKEEGTKFKIYYYKDLSVPVKVVDEVQKEKGFFRLVLFNGYFGLWSLAIFISYLLCSHYFFNKKNEKKY